MTIVVLGESLIDLLVDANGAVTAVPGGGPMNVARTVGRLGRGATLLTRFSTCPPPLPEGAVPPEPCPLAPPVPELPPVAELPPEPATTPPVPIAPPLAPAMRPPVPELPPEPAT